MNADTGLFAVPKLLGRWYLKVRYGNLCGLLESYFYKCIAFLDTQPKRPSRKDNINIPVVAYTVYIIC